MAFKMKTTANNTRNNNRDNDEFAGLWLNLGVDTQTEGETETKFARLPRNIAVGDLEKRKVYANTNPDWAEEVTLINSIIEMIQEEASKLEEGESIPINLSVRLYRQQSEVETHQPKTDTADLRSQLFSA